MQSTWIKPVDNLQQTCYHQTGASDANASLQQTCCNWWPDILPKDTLPKDILPKDILPNGHFADGHFVERTFYRTDSLTNGLFAEKTFCRNNNLPKIKKF